MIRWRKEEAAELYRRARTDPRRADLGLYAANGAYYLFLSLGPLTALLLSLLPFTPVTERELLDGALAQAPSALRQLVYAVVRDVYGHTGAVLSLSAVLELWSAARFLASVVRGVSAIGGVSPGGWFRRRAMGALYTAALILFILGNLTLLLFGERLLPAAGGSALWSLILRLRAGIFLAGLTAANALLFRRCAGSGKLRDRLPGAAAAAAGWLLFSRAYSWALERFGLFGVYGSIAAVSVSLYWMYGSLYILFAGAWLGQLLAEDRKGPGRQGFRGTG